jgi:hypothetical protein
MPGAVRSAIGLRRLACLASNEAACITGQNIRIDGGLTRSV